MSQMKQSTSQLKRLSSRALKSEAEVSPVGGGLPKRKSFDVHVVEVFDHAQIIQGLPIKALPPIAESLGLSPEELARRVGVSRATFHRKLNKPRQLLSLLESDALARYESLLSQAVETFDGDEEAARQWLSTGQPGLGNAVPLDLARTTVGFREVEKLLRRIDLGVYA